MADYKVPRRIELVAELPRDPNGKVLKRFLREELSRA
jgi:acyl-coenzyme A synthetase/AMP-(fatty) acid ligase